MCKRIFHVRKSTCKNTVNVSCERNHVKIINRNALLFRRSSFLLHSGQLGTPVFPDFPNRNLLLGNKVNKVENKINK